MTFSSIRLREPYSATSCGMSSGRISHSTVQSMLIGKPPREVKVIGGRAWEAPLEKVVWKMPTSDGMTSISCGLM